MWSFFILAFFCLAGWSSSQDCPAPYKRFSPHHTYCLPPNPTCQIRRNGASYDDKQLILQLHNRFRSKVAMGKENRTIGGTLPQAADMLQMVWDDELAEIAQKWTDHCLYANDCKECKATINFAVGQNLAIKNYSCPDKQCEDPSDGPDWKWAITTFYDEAVDYYKDWLGSFKAHAGPKTDQFTQLIWSRSWRVGCGYSFYKLGDTFHKYYVCNYGPGGNIVGQPVYKPGRPCEECPTKISCGSTSGLPDSYPGLCKFSHPTTAPLYRRYPFQYLLFCGATGDDPDCDATVSGVNRWNDIQSVGGNYYTIVLSGGESTTLTYDTPIAPHGDRFCLLLDFRKGPLDAAEKDQSSLKAIYQTNYATHDPKDLDLGTTTFSEIRIDLQWGMPTQLSLAFSVPKGAGRHVLDIRKVVAYDGACNSRSY